MNYLQTSLLCLIFLLLSCNTLDTEIIKQEIINADLAFSDLSVQKGANTAFLTYMDDQAVTLQNNRMPIVSKQEYKEFIAERDDSAFTLEWKPDNAFVAKSGELGYTYGRYELKVDTISQKGCYVTIWKKDEEGAWKFVLDTGTLGLGE